MLGLSRISGDLEEIERRASEGMENEAILSLKTYAYQIRKNIGGYMAAMGGLDVLVFTGSNGVSSSLVRALACQGFECMGLRLERERNSLQQENESARLISSPDSQVKVLVVPGREEVMIAREILKILEKEKTGGMIHTREQQPIPIKISAHHIHLSREDAEVLFDKDYQLTVKAELSQPG